MSKVEETGYAAVRKDMQCGVEWIEMGSFAELRELVAANNELTNHRIPNFDKDNPVQRIVRVKVVEQ